MGTLVSCAPTGFQCEDCDREKNPDYNRYNAKQGDSEKNENDNENKMNVEHYEQASVIMGNDENNN